MLLTETVQYVTGWKHEVVTGRGVMHSHDAFEIVYHRSGRGQVAMEAGGSHDFGPNGLEIMPRRWRHMQHQTKRGTDCCVQFLATPGLAGKLTTCIAMMLASDEYPAREIEAMSVLPRARNETEQRIYDCRLTAALLALLTKAGVMRTDGRSLTRRQRLAEDAHEYVRIHWREIRRIGQVAEALGISADYLRHAFVEQFGETVHDFLTRMRVEHAKDLLWNSQVPQKVMAGICGFADIQQFSRRFRQVTGMPPGEYRKGRWPGRRAIHSGPH
ncbi:MAG: helix-turn-helix transcriptional regulator [Phycisphaerales bacterium]